MSSPTPDQKPAKKPLNIKAIMMGLFATLNLGCIGTGMYFVFTSTLGYTPPSIREAELAEVRRLASEARDAVPSEPLVYTMEKMTVNLTGEPKRMIRIEVNVELLNPVGFVEIMEGDRRARVRDSVMTLLGEQSFSDIESIQGKLFLKDRIAKNLNALLDQGIVKSVYFSEFVVQ